ncbi:MAG TPA: polysaccharide biosynthesis tyrosine autokinase [Gemmatimonadaceae bacterium]|nr:polysaccharide biosynthesis tyrosine autokinase [Gemmatimonadaceae bacterium]
MTGDPFSLRDLMAAVRRRWWAVPLVFVLFVAMGIWKTMREPHIYRAATTVRIENSTSPIAGVQTAAPSYDYRIDPMVSEQQVIKSRMVAERVVNALGLRLRIVEPASLQRGDLFGGAPPMVDSSAPPGDLRVTFADRTYSLSSGAIRYATAPYGNAIAGAGVRFVVPERPNVRAQSVLLEILPLTAAAAEVRGSIGTKVLPQTNIVEIAYVGPEPALVRDIANTVAREYAAVSSEMQRTNARAKSQFIATSLRDQRIRLDSAQNALKEFKEREQIGDVNAEQSALVGSIHRMEEARQAGLVEQQIYYTLMGKLSVADSADEELRRLVGTEAVEKNRYIANLYDRWFSLVKERETLYARGRTDANEDVKAVQRLIGRTKEDVRSASQLYLQALQSRLGSLEKSIANQRQQTEKYPKLEAEQTRLAATMGTMQRTFDNLQSEFQLARIAESVDNGRVQSIDEATLPTFAISPNRKRAIFYSAVVGVLLGVVLAFGLDKLDDSVKSPDELRDQMELPMLGLIPAIRAERGSRRGVADTTAGRLITHADPRSPVAEAYRSMRTNLAFARAQQSPQAIVVASPGPSDGKSTTVANLAITFAQQGQRTLLIDADLRRAVLHKAFSAERSPGLTELIIGESTFDDVVHGTEVPNLSFIASGRFPPNPAELLGSARMQEILHEAKARFDVVLLDSPPLLAVTDAAVLSTMVDGVVLVIRTERTKRDAVRRALGHVRSVRGRLLGAVLNDVDMRSGAYYGSYGHYYYSYYGDERRKNGHEGGAVKRLRQLVGRGSATNGDGGDES